MNQFQKFDAIVIPKMHPMYAGLLWVSAALSDDETRYVLNHVLIERIEKRGEVEWKMVATDGRRIHVATYDAGMFADDLDMLEPGLWQVVIRGTKKVIVVAPAEELTADQYPKWRSVVPRRRCGFTDRVSARTTGKISIRTRQLFASDFLVEACGFGSGFKADKEVEISYSEDPTGKGALLVKHELGVAAVMPMALNEESLAVVEGEDTEAAQTPDLPHMPKREALPNRKHKGDADEEADEE